MEGSKVPHVAMIPSPGMGHLIPFVELAKRLVHNHGFMVTFVVVGEGPPSKVQRTVGKREGGQREESECLKWLDNQPFGSVLYVSFGSGGTLSCEQLNELALGLADSKQRFLWVIRSPNGAANSWYFDSHSQTDPLTFLPPEFLARTKDRGFVIDSWAPQAQIITYSSTGGFLTHCGWNSTMESIVNGVPLIAWPLYAEQKLNAILIAEDIHIALRAHARDDGVVVREEIARVVKRLMEREEGKELMECGEGKRVRNKMKKMKEGACRSMKDDGSFTKALTQLVLLT